MNETMRLSHVLYKVKDLHEAVKDFEEMGFTVRYGAKKEKAFNALIWFEEGPFIELFTVNPLAKIIAFFLKLMGKGLVAKRFNYFVNSDYGWSEYAIENERYDLDIENQKLKELGYKYSSLTGRRTNINDIKLTWQLSFPSDLGFPFLMSAYYPDPRPEHIQHENGAKSISQFTWGVSSKNMENIQKFTNDKRLKLEEGSGFKKIEFEGWDAGVLNKKYYK